MWDVKPSRTNVKILRKTQADFLQVKLLEYDNLLCYLTLLKSREKLQQQDKIWKKICEELKWEYIPSA